jgi:hypothetical protein
MLSLSKIIPVLQRFDHRGRLGGLRVLVASRAHIAQLTVLVDFDFKRHYKYTIHSLCVFG